MIRFTGLDFFDLVMRIWMTILLLLFMGQKSYRTAVAHDPTQMTPVESLSALDIQAQNLVSPAAYRRLYDAVGCYGYL